MRFIGITGGIGAGKSEILKYIEKHYKCEIYLADEAAHLVKQPGTKVYRKLVEVLGEEILEKDGSENPKNPENPEHKNHRQIDKKAMASRIFADPELLKQVNEIIHPAVREFLLEKLETAKKAGKADFFFVEAALLIETGYTELVDEMWYIHADEDVRRDRLRRSRGYSEEKISAIMSSQLTEQRFRESCDFVIDNSGAFQDSCRQIDGRLTGKPDGQKTESKKAK